jgi:CheY-like chemotaxis protein
MDKTIRLVLADDDSVDRELFSTALSETGLRYTLAETKDGLDLLNYLRNHTDQPDLIFLDLNMPRKDGREALRELKADVTLKTIPVIMLSTSSAPFDVDECYRSGANFFLSKPDDYHALVDMLTHLLLLSARYISFSRTGRA